MSRTSNRPLEHAENHTEDTSVATQRTRPNNRRRRTCSRPSTRTLAPSCYPRCLKVDDPVVGLSGLNGDPLRNTEQHLKNTFSSVFVIDDHSEPCEEAGSTARQEQVRKERRCRLRGIRRRIVADEAHVGTRHGQQHWEGCGKQAAN